MKCPECEGPTVKFGRNRNGSQRYKCLACEKTCSELKKVEVKEKVFKESQTDSIFDPAYTFSSEKPYNPNDDPSIIPMSEYDV